MANLTGSRTRPTHPVAVIDVERVYDDIGDEAEIVRIKFALRSDGKILRRTVWSEPVDKSGEPRWYGTKPGTKTHRLMSNDSYSIWRSLKPGVPVTRETLERVIARIPGVTVVGAK
jgi:hypothetical protein